jgi:hypothetical protein
MINPVAIEAHKKTVLFAMLSHLYTKDIEHILNDFHRSEVTEESVLADFYLGDIPTHVVPKDEHYYAALEHTRSRFAPPVRCRPAHIFDVQHHYPLKAKSNAEAPFSTEKRFLNELNDPQYRAIHNLPENCKATNGNMKNIIFKHVHLWLHQIKDGTAPAHEYLYYMLLHSKTAITKRGKPDKIRTIWGTPKPFIIAEIMLHWSLLAHYKRNPGISPLLWGYETLIGGWFRLNAELFSSHLRSSFVTLDKFRFDKFALFSVFDDLDQMTLSFLDFDNGYLPTIDYPDTQSTWSPERATRLRRLFDWTCRAFRNTPIVLPNGYQIRRTCAGVPSGLYTTQYRDSIYNHLTIVTCLLSLGITIPQILVLKVLGDDSLTKLALFIQPHERLAFLEAFQQAEKYYFNSYVDPFKSALTDLNHTEVLGYINNHGIATRDDFKLIASLYHTKSSNPTPVYTMSAALGYAYASCANDTRFYNVYKDIFNYYLKQGYSPSLSIASSHLSADPDSVLSLKSDKFPTISEIQSHFFRFDYNAPVTMKTFFPTEHFLTYF